MVRGYAYHGACYLMSAYPADVSGFRDPGAGERGLAFTTGKPSGVRGRRRPPPRSKAFSIRGRSPGGAAEKLQFGHDPRGLGGPLGATTACRRSGMAGKLCGMGDQLLLQELSLI